MSFWDIHTKGFKNYLVLERSLSSNTISSYIRDVEKFLSFLKTEAYDIKNIHADSIQHFLATLHEQNLSARSQARILSTLRLFFKYLLLENLIETNPMSLIQSPKIAAKLPSFLTIQEFRTLVDSIDVSKPNDARNKTMLEVMYACGLRVSELIALKISNLFLSVDIIKIVGKRNKERLVPINHTAKQQLTNYLQHIRCHIQVHKDFEDYVFLNQRGKSLSRVYVFNFIKKYADNIGLKKNISPHSFRHTFATHMVEAGVNLRAVQDLLGHENILTTEIYTHLNTSYLKESVDAYHPRNKNKEKE